MLKNPATGRGVLQGSAMTSVTGNQPGRDIPNLHSTKTNHTVRAIFA
jgi:hypothetical protein